MSSPGPGGTPDPESPAWEEPGTDPRTTAAVERLHAEIVALRRELPGLVDDAEAAASEE
ncbi:hypothetical protein [Patulibacter sp.]|uniref:hypothetical protein n=1 Tax=Patulibacter sp. TaxID=1912859 RepID=UPI002727FCED|nr:hypothetical protein [Patulibacter sp.]MDO9409553.1 hypothetical protein [Patulibacter sp.]